MKKMINSIVLSLLSALSFCSCQSETATKQISSSDNIISLEDLVTRGEASAQFAKIVSQGTIVVDFYAPWCGPCKLLGNAIHDIAPQFPNIAFLKVNVDIFSNIPREYKSIPEVHIYHNGKKVYKQVGAPTKPELLKLLQKYY